MQKPPDSLNTQTNISRDVGQLVGQHSKWRDFVTRQEPTVVAEPHGSPLRDELLAEEALEEVITWQVCWILILAMWWVCS